MSGVRRRVFISLAVSSKVLEPEYHEEKEERDEYEDRPIKQPRNGFRQDQTGTPVPHPH
jgi:hypothetical protein